MFDDVESDSEHWSSNSTSQSATKIQSLHRGRTTRKKRELFDLIGQPTFKTIDFHRSITKNLQHFLTLAHQTKFTTYASPKTAFLTLSKLRSHRPITFAKFLEISKTDTDASTSRNANNDTTAVAALYSYLGSKPSLFNLFKAYSNNYQATAAHVRNAGLHVLLVPKSASLAFQSIRDQRKLHRSTINNDDLVISMKEKANQYKQELLQINNPIITFQELVSLIQQENDHAAVLFHDLTVYASDNKSLNLVALHRALSHSEEATQKIRNANMECLLSPKSATKAFTHLRSLQDQDEMGSPVTLEHFRSLAKLTFPKTIEQPIDPIETICNMMNNNVTFVRWLRLFISVHNIDRLSDQITMAGLSPLLVPNNAVVAFRDMTCVSKITNPSGNGTIDVAILKHYVQHGLRWTRHATKIQQFAKSKVQEYNAKKKACMTIQKCYRWNFGLLPWAIASVRIQRQW